jgi:hypothetical protein
MNEEPFDFSFRARIWLYEGAARWHFVTLPKDVSNQIRLLARGESRPGGSLRVTASTGVTRWKTSIFRDQKRNAYLLPLKFSVRQREQLRAGDSVEISLVLEI